MYSQRVTPAQPAIIHQHLTVPPILFSKIPQDNLKTDDYMEELFLSDEKILTQEMLKGASNITLRYIGDTSRFWRIKNKRRGRTSTYT